MQEKIKRRIEEDALLKEQAPTKRLKLVPKAGHTNARNKQQGPKRKKQKIEARKDKKTKALTALFPELQQQESQSRDVLQNNIILNRNASTNDDTKHQPMQDIQIHEPTKQSWYIPEIIDIEKAPRKQGEAPIAPSLEKTTARKSKQGSAPKNKDQNNNARMNTCNGYEPAQDTQIPEPTLQDRPIRGAIQQIGSKSREHYLKTRKTNP